ncbi:MAG: DUF445 domain-containing protein [Acidimicrobiia bacterium]|nr:DUF445 domain-containing protein [Acidimicrobiia bacterium]
MSRSGSPDPSHMAVDAHTRQAPADRSAAATPSAADATRAATGTTGAGSTPSTPPVQRAQERQRQLARMKRRATGMLVAITVVFVLVTVLTDGTGFWGYVEAMAAASMVGGLADWFAVTALFRHPMGLPIPHTAVIVERKDEFGRTLGEFVQENFLSAGVVTERVRNARMVERTADWLSNPANAAQLSGHAADLAVGLADLINDEDVHRLIDEELSSAVARLPLATMVGQGLQMMTAENRHHELFDAILRNIEQFLDGSRDTLRIRFAQEAPWWLPEAVDDRIFERLFDGVRRLLQDINRDPNHEVRRQFDTWLVSLIDQLQHSPEMQGRVDELKREVLDYPQLRDWTGSLWGEVKKVLREQAGEPQSALRARISDGIQALGHRLREDEALRAKAGEMVEEGVAFLAEHFHEELAGLISGTVERWDASETSQKLELLLGRDLQWIRINGTVVGGLAGLVIHAVAQALA